MVSLPFLQQANFIITLAALSVTEPKKGVEIDPSTSFDVKWTSVEYVHYSQFISRYHRLTLSSTDASSFDIYIVNNAVYPPVNKKIASNIKTSSDSYTVDSVDVSAGYVLQKENVLQWQSPNFNTATATRST